ncbi:Uncharacterised protein [Vibrio cholerae]|uniref:Uncharacterized protein n=1 Tax=Vibrio cholerae TaxID=666 RepID=A0A656AP70_VIBCL|nr:Uncharacterised protein [Vibrio cholerae]CSA39736.1 Uncharacterised protein [Vibrio cholerae]CSB21886.1 Uncharacterised protein [Vibrio cholerae]CSB83619.1 Uncharacterised protein [Vibrio cholerae]CSB89565.1 Uncharacterised protein [Vibrio cholerae]
MPEEIDNQTDSDDTEPDKGKIGWANREQITKQIAHQIDADIIKKAHRNHTER